MKISNIKNLRAETISRSDLYTVESPRGVITAIDKDENLLDLYPQTALKYTIQEAEILLQFMKKVFPDFSQDPYYKRGTPIYPIFQPPSKLGKIEKFPYIKGLTVYRYKQAGEAIYGLTNKWSDEEPESFLTRAIEAPMDGWDKWLDDRKRMLSDRWIAENGGNLDL